MHVLSKRQKRPIYPNLSCNLGLGIQSFQNGILELRWMLGVGREAKTEGGVAPYTISF